MANCFSSYDSRQAWFQHELEAHRTDWQCIEGCDKSFAAQHDFDEHVRSSHVELIPMLPMLRRTSAKVADTAKEVVCQLCEKHMSLRNLQRHLASHHQQLALFVLPPNLDESEEIVNEGTFPAEEEEYDCFVDTQNSSQDHSADDDNSEDIDLRAHDAHSTDTAVEIAESYIQQDSEPVRGRELERGQGMFHQRRAVLPPVSQTGCFRERFAAYNDFRWELIESYLKQKWPHWTDFNPTRANAYWYFEVPEKLPLVSHPEGFMILLISPQEDIEELRKIRDAPRRRRRRSSITPSPVEPATVDVIDIPNKRRASNTIDTQNRGTTRTGYIDDDKTDVEAGVVAKTLKGPGKELEQRPSQTRA